LRRLAPARSELPALFDEYNELGRKVSAEEAPHFEAMHEQLQEISAVMEQARRTLEPMATAAFETPVIRAFMSVPGARSGFTPYGRTSSRESFAEAFSLFRADPEACRRISPEGFAFFASGGHTRRPPGD
jgi:hypothetical protein